MLIRLLWWSVRCSNCKADKESYCFYVCNKSKTGRASKCKECIKSWRKLNLERTSKLLRERWKNDLKFRNKKRDSFYRKTFGLTLKQYEEMRFAQENLCVICKKPELIKHGNSDVVRELAVDHCHKTGKIRGLLCTSCNIILGHAKDDFNLLYNAAKYLELNSD